MRRAATLALHGHTACPTGPDHTTSRRPWLQWSGGMTDLANLDDASRCSDGRCGGSAPIPQIGFVWRARSDAARRFPGCPSRKLALFVQQAPHRLALFSRRAYATRSRRREPQEACPERSRGGAKTAQTPCSTAALGCLLGFPRRGVWPCAGMTLLSGGDDIGCGPGPCRPRHCAGPPIDRSLFNCMNIVRKLIFAVK